MPVIVESLVLILFGVGIALGLMQLFGRGSGTRETGAPSVKILRSPRTPDGREETRLTLNDQPILLATNDGVRLADYADEVEQVEALAARLAAALGVTVEFARLPSRKPGEEPQIMVRDLPRAEEGLDEEDLPARRSRLSRGGDEGRG